MTYNVNSSLKEIIADPSFGNFGRLLFPVNERHYTGDTLQELQMTWYNFIRPEKSAEVINHLKSRADGGETVFYDIYTEEEKELDPEKKDTGLFFFKGEAGESFAVCCAGGGFQYVGAIHDSFPLSLELSRKGYNAFALIYRPDAVKSCEDLARAIEFIFSHAEEFEVSTEGYSLWGGSAGARMVANLGSFGTEGYGAKKLPKAAAVIMQYTGHGDFAKNDPPTYANVGKRDQIVDWHLMEDRYNAMKAVGIPVELRIYDDLPHGYALGIGTDAEGWHEEAIAFWKSHR